MTETIAAPTLAKPAFGRELRDLADGFAHRSVKLGELLGRTEGRGIDLLLIIAALPFLTPIPLPGFSLPFGILALITGTRMALNKKPWLPQKLLARELPPRVLGKILRASSRIVNWLEHFLRPRLEFLTGHAMFWRLAGVFILLCGLLLTLPLPIPFSNSLPALTILLLAAGALERDGLAFLMGSATFLLTSAYFVFLAFGGAEAVQHLHKVITH